MDSAIQDELKWPMEVSFPPTKRERDPVDDPDSVPSWDPRIAPECDKGDAANFTLLISSNITQPAIGHNVTFNMTLIRAGNGSEYPAYIDMYHSTDRNVTYAWDYITSEDEYWGLVSCSADKNEVYYSDTAQKMLVTPTMEALENERKFREDQADGPMMTRISGGIGGIFPMCGNGARYEFRNDDGLVEQDTYEFGVELPMHYRDFPSFEKTFETIRSQLQFTLHTAFACDLRPVHEDETPMAEEKEVKLDDEWRNYELPLRKKKKWGTGGLNRAIQKRATTPFDARLLMASEEKTTKAVHYLDSTALGPIITDTTTENVDFPLLNQEKREEDKEERVKRRKWDDNSPARSGGWCKPDKKTRNGRWGNAEPSRCWEFNGGGGSRHAGRMWQAREARREGKEAGRRESIGGTSDGIVFQN